MNRTDGRPVPLEELPQRSSAEDGVTLILVTDLRYVGSPKPSPDVEQGDK